MNNVNYKQTENGLLEDKKIEVEISDTVGNKGTASKTINIDRVVPVIIFESNPLGLGKDQYTFTKNIKVVNYGPLGGTINGCDPAESKKTGKYKVNCTATGTNGLTTSQLFNVRHSFAANPVACDKECGQECGESCKCLHYGFCESTSGNCVTCSGSSSLCCDDQECTPYCKPKYCPSTCYECPSGTTLSGTTCNY